MMSDNNDTNKNDTFNEVISAVKQKAKDDLIDAILNDLPQIPKDIDVLRDMIKEGFEMWQKKSGQCDLVFSNILEKNECLDKKVDLLEKRIKKMTVFFSVLFLLSLLSNYKDVDALIKTLLSVTTFLNGAF